MSDTFTPDSTATQVAAVLAPHIKDKVILITGSSPNGLGLAAATAMAAHAPRLLILAGRSQGLLEEAAASLSSTHPSLKTRLLVFDLVDLKSVRAAAAEVRAYAESIDVLVNNAGIMALGQLGRTPDGVEMQFAVNHLGHFLFTGLIVDKLPRGARIANITSGGYAMGGIDFEDVSFETRPYHKWQAYGQSKTANILFSAALAQRLQSRGILSFSVDVGGGIYTNLQKYLTEDDYAGLSAIKILTQDQGASTYIAAAFDPSIADSNGAYLLYCKPTPTKEECPWARGQENADRLWAMSEEMVGEKFGF